MATTVTFTTWNDADFIKRFRYRANGAPVDLTGSVLLMSVRKAPDNKVAEIEVRSDEPYTTETGGIVITDQIGGDFWIHLPLNELRFMPVGEYVHSLIRLRPEGVSEPMWHGTLTHGAGPTR